MRSDSSLPDVGFRRSSDWRRDPISGVEMPEIDNRYSVGHEASPDGRKYHSFSGSERNRLFLNSAGKNFRDESALSGLNNIADGRSFVAWDFNHDGKTDIALANANQPLLNIYRNDIGNVGSHFLAVRLVGGNSGPAATSEWSNRNGIGSLVTIQCGAKSVKRELHCGEGFAAQNSSTLIIGLGSADSVSVKIKWPSGRVTETHSVDPGMLVTAYEVPDHSASKTGFDLASYSEIDSSEAAVKNQNVFATSTSSDSTLRLYTSFATWCAACKKQLPQLLALRSHFDQGELAMFGVAVDPIESEDLMDDFFQDQNPPYQLVVPSRQELESFRQICRRALQVEEIPTTIVTDHKSRVFGVFKGVPTVSEIGRLLAKED